MEQTYNAPFQRVSAQIFRGALSLSIKPSTHCAIVNEMNLLLATPSETGALLHVLSGVANVWALDTLIDTKATL